MPASDGPRVWHLGGLLGAWRRCFGSALHEAGRGAVRAVARPDGAPAGMVYTGFGVSLSGAWTAPALAGVGEG